MLGDLPMIYTVGHISGCHINPAVTVALAASRKMAWADVPRYLGAQFAGGIVGGFAIWSILERPGLDAGLGVLSYAPGHARAAFCAELIGTFLLVLVVFGTTTDSRATPGWYGLAIPAIVFAVITVAGPVTGAALNPARYLGPMTARAALGGGKGLLWNQAPVYLIAPFAAGLLAAATYAFLGSVGPAPAPATTGSAGSSAGDRPKPSRKPARRAAMDRPGRHGITMVDATMVRAWVDEAAHLVDDNTQYLTHLDAVIGDADHGTNMRRGFHAAVLTLDEVPTPTPGAVLDAAGQAFLANLGGAAGPLYAAGFRNAAEALGPAVAVSAVQFGVALQAALTGIQELGAAVVGDKTMVDAWSPAVTAYQAVINTGGDLREATSEAAAAAERGLRATATMQARKGPASHIGAPTIRHQGPGAASTALIPRILGDTIEASPAGPVPWVPARRLLT